MEGNVRNEGIDSATPEMKEKSRNLVRALTIGVVAGTVTGIVIAIWIAGSDWIGTMIATSLCVMGASATIGGLMGANFAQE